MNSWFPRRGVTCWDHNPPAQSSTTKYDYQNNSNEFFSPEMLNRDRVIWYSIALHPISCCKISVGRYLPPVFEWLFLCLINIVSEKHVGITLFDPRNWSLKACSNRCTSKTPACNIFDANAIPLMWCGLIYELLYMCIYIPIVDGRWKIIDIWEYPIYYW